MKKLSNHELSQVNGGATAVEYGSYFVLAAAILTPILGSESTSNLLNSIASWIDNNL